MSVEKKRRANKDYEPDSITVEEYEIQRKAESMEKFRLNGYM